ncbi:MAG: hypothetical protein ABI565_02975, partial [Vicinamibacteria bacterium]
RVIVVLFIFRLGGIVLRALLYGFGQGAGPRNSSGGGAGAPRGPSPEPRGQVEELVKDPVCGVHTARSSAIVGRYRGAVAYFCSEECAAKASAGSA